MDIKEIQEQAFQRGLAEGRKNACDTRSMCNVFASCEDASVNYVEFPDGLRLIFRDGNYAGWDVCDAVADGEDMIAPTKFREMAQQLRYCAEDEACGSCKRWDLYHGSSSCINDLMLRAAELLDGIANGVRSESMQATSDEKQALG